jgi:hypothetical protein
MSAFVRFWTKAGFGAVYSQQNSPTAHGTLPLQSLDPSIICQEHACHSHGFQMWPCGGAGVKLVRGFASLLAYVVGVSAIISIGVAGLMALQSPSDPSERTPFAPDVALESRTERLAKPVKQTIVAQKKARPDQKHKMVHVTPRRTHEAPTITEGDSYGYAAEPRRIDSNLLPFFGR